MAVVVVELVEEVLCLVNCDAWLCCSTDDWRSFGVVSVDLDRAQCIGILGICILCPLDVDL